MTEREVLKMALEALEYWHEKYQDSNDLKAITAIKKVLAQPEQEPLDTSLPCDVKVGHVTISKGVALSVLVARMQVLYDMAQSAIDKPKEPEQEPCRHRIADIRNEAVKSGYMCMDCGALFGAYTAQPHRKPLSDEEIENLWQNTSPYYDYQDFARAIEAAHGIWPENSDCHGPDWTDRDGEYLK